MRIAAREFLRVGGGLQMRRPVRVAFHSDRGQGNHGRLGEPLFQIVIASLAVGQREPPAVVVDGNGDVIRIVERLGAAVERRVVEVPFR